MALVIKQQTHSSDIVAVEKKGSNELVPAGLKRTSGLQSPTMQLTGHEGAVHSVRFDPSGNLLASASFDKSIFLWQVYGDCKNFMVLRGHTSSVQEVHWSHDGKHLVSGSADKTCILWDSEIGYRLRRFTGHTGFINSVALSSSESRTLIASSSDDRTVKIWDSRSKRPVKTLRHEFPVTAVAFGSNPDILFTGSIDNQIRMWDLNASKISLSLCGHTDTISNLRVNREGSHLLSNSMDSTLRIWDVNPFVRDENQRCLKVLIGAKHDYEKLLIKAVWSADGKMVASGSSDRCVYIWDSTTQEVLYQLPGHKGCVVDVDFHPTEPIIASASIDRSVFLGELLDQ